MTAGVLGSGQNEVAGSHPVTSNPPKRIQLFFDGTANSAAYGRWSDATNIFRMILALQYAGNQIVFYMPGVGTRRDWMSIVTAQGMDESYERHTLTLPLITSNMTRSKFLGIRVAPPLRLHL
jgi:hypothetical protein